MKPRIFLLCLVMLTTAPFLCAQERDIRIEKPTGRKFAFLVGVTEYEYPNTFPTLTYTVQDVRALQKQLESVGFEPGNIIVMASNTSVSRQPTKRKILAQLEELLKKTGKDDIIICMFSGHGTQIGKDQYFCPEDARVADLAGSCVPLNEVLDTLKQSSAKFKWLIVDACRNDPTKSTPDGVRSIGKVESVPKGVTAIFSCAETEKSYEDTTLEHGVFTHFLIQGLAGKAVDKNGVVTILDLYKYVQEETQSFVKSKHNTNQVPYWDGEFTNFILRDDLLIEGVSREKWLQADAAYKQAQEYRRKKEYVNAAKEIQKALSILPTKGEFLDEKQMIDLMASSAAPTVTVKPEPPTGQSQNTSQSVVQGTQPQEISKPNLVAPSWDKPEEWLKSLQDIKDLKECVEIQRYIALMEYADATNDNAQYFQARNDFFMSLRNNVSRSTRRIEFILAIWPGMLRHNNFDGLKDAMTDIDVMMDKKQVNDDARWAYYNAVLAGFALVLNDKASAEMYMASGKISRPEYFIDIPNAVAQKTINGDTVFNKLPRVDSGVGPRSRATPLFTYFCKIAVHLAQKGDTANYMKFIANAKKHSVYYDGDACLFAIADAKLGEFDRARLHWKQYNNRKEWDSLYCLSFIFRQEFLAGEFRGWETKEQVLTQLYKDKEKDYLAEDIGGSALPQFYFDYGRGIARHKTNKEITDEYGNLSSTLGKTDLAFFMAGVATGLQDRKKR